MAKRSPKSVKKACDTLFSKLIRSVGRCCMCGARDNLACHHSIINRVPLVTRWDESNGLCLCMSCHSFAHLYPHHQSVIGAIIKEVGQEEYDRVRGLVAVYKKMTLADYLELEAELKEKLDEALN